MINLTEMEMLGLYVLLRRHEKDLDSNTAGIKHKIEELLFDLLTIDELENLEQSYVLEGRTLMERLKHKGDTA
ncbi:MAG: hypothetical protein E4H36_00780 [Spirochaetales bacterium]|nr:MAG: hypothetical protein E4H36_00780 [Spirochaetales bacterium]